MKCKPNIILFTRFFPPLISGGSRRSLHIVKGFRELGYHVSIVAPELPPGEAGIEIPHPQAVPSSDDRFTDWKTPLRSLLLWPDADINWVKRAYKATCRSGILKPDDVVITTSPPESIHSIGYRAKKELGSLWIADFRDSWLVDPLNKVRENVLRRVGERRIANKWLSKVDLAIAPSQTILEEMVTLSKRDTPCIEVPQSAEEVVSVERKKTNLSFVLVHAGSFTLSDRRRQIKPLLELINEIPQHKSLNLKLVGRLTNDEHQLAKQMLGDRVQITGAISREKTLEAISQADALVLVVAPGRSAVPGKLAEYAMTKKPIVFLGGGAWQDLARLPIEVRDKSSLKQLEEILDGKVNCSLLSLPPSPKEIAIRMIDQLYKFYPERF